MVVEGCVARFVREEKKISREKRKVLMVFFFFSLSGSDVETVTSLGVLEGLRLVACRLG